MEYFKLLLTLTLLESNWSGSKSPSRTPVSRIAIENTSWRNLNKKHKFQKIFDFSYFFDNRKFFYMLILWFSMHNVQLTRSILIAEQFCWLYKKKKKILKIKGVPKILCILHIVNYLRNTAFDFPQIIFGDQWQSYLKFIIKGWIRYSTSKEQFKNVQIYGHILTLTKCFTIFSTKITQKCWKIFC